MVNDQVHLVQWTNHPVSVSKRIIIIIIIIDGEKSWMIHNPWLGYKMCDRVSYKFVRVLHMMKTRVEPLLK